MSAFNFFQAFNILKEAGEAPMGGPPSGGGPDMGAGGPPGMPPMGAGGPPGGMGGPPGMDGGMGGEAPMGGQPIEVKAIPVGDVWKLIEKIVSDEKYGKFFEEINIKKKKSPILYSPKKDKKTSLIS